MNINLKGFKSNCGHTQMGDLAIHRGRRMTESETLGDLCTVIKDLFN